MKTISNEAFEKLLATSRIGERQQGRASRIKKALFLHLVQGVPVREAARRAGNVSPQAVYKKIARLLKKESKPRPTCPYCHQPLPSRRRLLGPARSGSTSA